MEGSKPASSTTSKPAAFASTPSASSSLVEELFGKPASQTSSSVGNFDFLYSTPTNRDVGKEVFASVGQARKNEQWEYKNWQPRKASSGGSFPRTERHDGVMANKNPSFHSNEVVEPTLSTSSIHYGGREDYVSPSVAEKYSRRTNTYEKKDEDISDGGSPRGNFWQGSFHY